MWVLLWADMEGMSRVADHCECWPVFLEYWRAGRRKFTGEVVAAATGLLQGGASAVFVVNRHGLGWPNVLWDELLERVVPADDDAWGEGFDAMFQIGFHARAGTVDGFVSHTMVPGLRVAVDGAPVTECHIWAWLAGLPVLGIAGDAAMGGQLDAGLDGTPFLEVKRSVSRTETTPIHHDPDGSLNALREFARHCGQAPPAPAPGLPSRFTFAVSMDPELSSQAEGRHGLTRASASVLSKQAEDWGRDAQPALEAAMAAALRPLLAAQADLDLSSEAAMNRQDPAKLQRFRAFFVDWVQADEPTWRS